MTKPKDGPLRRPAASAARARKTPIILVADDDPVSRRMLEKNLKSFGYRVRKAVDGNRAWTALQDPDIRIAVLDWMMPGLDGPEVCRRARETSRANYTYIIILTAKDNPKDIITGIRAGADDYMTKPVKLPELRVRLQAGLRIIELEDTLLENQKRLTDLATRDGLTGLWNRAAILQFLKEALDHGRRDGYPAGIIMIDVDHFKSINDLHGHQAGDAVLRAVAGTLGKSVRPYDKVGRYGGDELMVVLPNCSLYQVSKIAERIRSAGAGLKVKSGGRFLGISLSIGCTSSECFLQPEANGLLLASDKALYEAKRGGRNRVAVSDAVEGTPVLPAPKERGRGR